MRILVASGNQNKIRELSVVANEFNLELCSPSEVPEEKSQRRETFFPEARPGLLLKLIEYINIYTLLLSQQLHKPFSGNFSSAKLFQKRSQLLTV